MIKNLQDYVKIRPFGGIILFDSILCDGEDAFIDSTNISCFTHIHLDHIAGFDDALKKPHSTVLTTSLTKELIGAMKGPSFVGIKNKFHGLEYKEEKKIDDFNISFHRCNHILGSGQLLVRGNLGSVLYSSDFMLKGTDTEIDDVDVLVLDGNHGSESISQTFLEPSQAKKDLKQILQNEISIKRRQVNLRAHVGTLQKLMMWADEICPRNIPFFANSSNVALSSVYKKHMRDFREIKSDQDYSFSELSKFQQPYVHFMSLTAKKELCETQDPMVTTIHFSDTRTSYDHTNDYSQTAALNLKEHASFYEILDYVQLLKPKMVVVDNGPTRLGASKNAIDLSKAITTKCHIPATFLPPKRPGEKND